LVYGHTCAHFPLFFCFWLKALIGALRSLNPVCASFSGLVRSAAEDMPESEWQLAAARQGGDSCDAVAPPPL
jgi:hypothetical protein